MLFLVKNEHSQFLAEVPLNCSINLFYFDTKKFVFIIVQGETLSNDDGFPWSTGGLSIYTGIRDEKLDKAAGTKYLC